MEAGQLVQQRQLEQNKDELLRQQQQQQTEPAIKKDNEEQGIRRSNVDVSSEKQISGGKPALEAEVSQGGVALQSYHANFAITNVDSASRERIQEKLPALEEPLESGRGRDIPYRLRNRTRAAKKHNEDHVDSGLLELSDDEEQRSGKGVVVKQSRKSRQCIWGEKRRRSDRRSSREFPDFTSSPESNQANETINSGEHHGRAKISQDDMAERLNEQRSQGQRYVRSCDDGREAPPRAQLLQDEISARKEKHPGRLLDEGDWVVGDTEVTPASSLSSCKLDRPVRGRSNMVTHIEASPRDLGGGQEGSAATSMKPPIRKRKAGILADDEFPEANGLDALSNRRPRSDGAEMALPQQFYEPSSETEEVADHPCCLVAADSFQHTSSPASNLQVLPTVQNPSINWEFAPRDSQLVTLDAFAHEEMDAFIYGKLYRPETLKDGSQSRSGRETTPPPPFDDFGASIGSHFNNSSQLEGGVQHGDGFSLANDSLGTAESEARLSSDDASHLPSLPAYHHKMDNVGIPIPTNSYPSRSRRSLPFRTDAVPQRVGSIAALMSSDVRAPPEHPNNAAQPLSNMSAVLHVNPIPDNRHPSLGTSVVHSMNDAGMVVLDGDEDFEPDDGNLFDEEDEEGQEGLLDLNESPEQQNLRPKNSRARKKHRPKVFREGRPDRRRKPKNAAEGISTAKAGEEKKVDGKPRGRKKRATSDLKSAQREIYPGNQGDHFMPEAANCGPAIDGCRQCQDTERISDAGRGMHLQGGRAMGTEDSLRSREDSGFPQNAGPQTSPQKTRLEIGPNNELVETRVPNSPNGRDFFPSASSASASSSPSRKRSGEDEGRVVADRGHARRELFKQARNKRITAHSNVRSGWEEKWQESMNEAIAHPSAVSAAKAVGTKPGMGTDASNSQELGLLESQEPSMGQELRDPAAEVVGAVMPITSNPSNSGEGVSNESSIISTEMGILNESITIPEGSFLQANHGRLKAAARANARQPNSSNRVKLPYTRRPKQADSARLLDLFVNKLTTMDLEEIDSGLQLVPHANQNRAMVLHANQNRAMVPFMPLRRKKPRARVMLDGEDKRVWRLLMTQGTSFEDEFSQKEAPRQWEEERATMEARAEKFINRMHLVQGDRRFSVWKGSVVDSVVGAFLTQNVSDILSSSAFMCLAARFPVARKKRAAAETSQEATVMEVQVEEAYEISLKAIGDPTFRDGAEPVQEGTMTTFHVEEAFDISEKSSATEEGSSICCNQQGNYTLSTKLIVIDSERDTEPTTQILERSGGSTVQEHIVWSYYEERLTDTREQNSSCSSKSSQSQCNSNEHNATSHAGDSLEVREIEEHKTCGVVEDSIFLHSGSGDVFLETSAQGQLNSFDSTPLVDVGDSEVATMAMPAPNSWIQRESGLVEESLMHNVASRAGDRLEVRECAEHQTCGVVDDSISLHSGSGDVFLGSSGQGQINSFDLTSLVDVGESEAAPMAMPSPNSWVQPESELVEGYLTHNITSHAGDSLEVSESEEHKTCALVEDSISLHSGSEDVFLGSSGQSQLHSSDSILLVDAGKTQVATMAMPAHNSWIQPESELVEGLLFVDLSPTEDDDITDLESTLEATRYGPHESANNSRTHEIGGNSIPQQVDSCSASPGLDVTRAAAEEIAASSGSVVSSSGSLDANKLLQSSATPGSDKFFSIDEEIGAYTAEGIVLIDNFDTNFSCDQEIVISSAAEPSEHLHRELEVSFTTESSHLRTVKSLMRTNAGTKGRSMRKGRQKTGPQSLDGTNNSELVNSVSDNLEMGVHGPKKRPVISLTGIARARLEQSNITSKVAFDWEAVRLKYTGQEMGENQHESAHAGCKSFGSSDVENGVDWDAVRSAKLEDIADVIKERGMNYVLAGRIKAFLERVQKEHGSVDLEWLRTVSVEEAKSFLLSIRGLGLKSVECIRLLTLHHLAFPVDTNVGRICVRLGWVPLEPLPEELQLHLLELYPVQETIQKYLWPRLCTLDQRTLYELHYQMITFGKVFCTKSRPNCNACPMRDDCRHFASALASARLALPAAAHEDPHPTNSEPLALPAAAAEFLQKVKPALPPSEQDDVSTGEEAVALARLNSSILSQKPCEPIVEEPRTPEPEIGDIEDFEAFGGVSSQPSGSEKGSSSEIELVLPPAEVLIQNTSSQALVVLPPDSTSIPVPKLKNIGRLRTVHYVYELPDSHPLVQEMDPREDDDPCFYLLAIWSPGESPHAPPVLDDMYTNGTCDGFNSSEEETVKGTVLVPCRTAMRGIFPLNGTYFQVNEVFADHASSLQPIEVPRTLLWNLRRRFVYFGTSVTSIFKGLSTEEIQACFWRGYVCVRGFDSVSRCPRPLAARLHFSASKMVRKQKEETFNAED